MTACEQENCYCKRRTLCDNSVFKVYDNDTLKVIILCEMAMAECHVEQCTVCKRWMCGEAIGMLSSVKEAKTCRRCCVYLVSYFEKTLEYNPCYLYVLFPRWHIYVRRPDLLDVDTKLVDCERCRFPHFEWDGVFERFPYESEKDHISCSYLTTDEGDEGYHRLAQEARVFPKLASFLSSYTTYATRIIEAKQRKKRERLEAGKRLVRAYHLADVKIDDKYRRKGDVETAIYLMNEKSVLDFVRWLNGEFL